MALSRSSTASALKVKLGPSGDSDAAVFVQTELETRGVDAAAIAGLNGSEIAELYIVLTSGDENEIRTAIDSVTNS